MTYYIWLFSFVVVFPFMAYHGARQRELSNQYLLAVGLIALAIPILIFMFGLLASFFGWGLDSNAIYEVSQSPQEFFATLATAKKPYETTLPIIVLLQLILTVCLTVSPIKARMFALSVGIAGLHMSLIAGVFLLNVFLGEWPGS